MLDTDSVCQIVADELNKPGLASFINAKVIVHCLRNYRDWKSHTLQYSPVSFETLLQSTLFSCVDHSVGVLLVKAWSCCHGFKLYFYHPGRGAAPRRNSKSFLPFHAKERWGVSKIGSEVKHCC